MAKQGGVPNLENLCIFRYGFEHAKHVLILGKCFRRLHTTAESARLTQASHPLTPHGCIQFFSGGLNLDPSIVFIPPVRPVEEPQTMENILR